MLSTALAKKLIRRARSLDAARRALQTLSAEILSASKRAIFAFHRGDKTKAALELDGARKKLKEGFAIVKAEARLAQEGSWRAAQEEFAEADLFAQYAAHGTVGAVGGVSDDTDIFLGALSDLSGELVRRAVLLASDRDRKSVETIFADVRAVVDFLLEMDLTGHLRTKVDQAKQNLRKLEEIRYDLSLRR